MRIGQSALEYLTIYGIVLFIVGFAVALIFVLDPALFSPYSTPTVSGFQGLKIVSQGYSGGTFSLDFQNLLNENINVDGISFVSGSVNSNAFTCETTLPAYMPPLDSDSCNLTVSLPSNFNAQIIITYTPSNSSFSQTIAIKGQVTN
jgi:hypothetical protein